MGIWNFSAYDPGLDFNIWSVECVHQAGDESSEEEEGEVDSEVEFPRRQRWVCFDDW